MGRSGHLRLSYANVMATVAVFLAIGGGSLAIGGVFDDQGEIAACYDKGGRNKGDVRLLLKGRCTRQEKPITWSQEGPQGIQGQQGPPGQPGQRGQPGQDGEDGADGSPDTPQQVLDKVKQVDGPGSALDADVLDGQHASAFVEPGDVPGGSDLGGTYGSPTIAPDAVALGADTTGNYVESVSTGTGLTGGGAGSEGASPNLGFDYSGNTSLGGGESVFGSNGLIFEGNTVDGNELSVTPSGPTADRTITLPDSSGTAITTGNLSAITSVGSLTGTIPLSFEGTTVDAADIRFQVTDPLTTQTITIPPGGGGTLGTFDISPLGLTPDANDEITKDPDDSFQPLAAATASDPLDRINGGLPGEFLTLLGPFANSTLVNETGAGSNLVLNGDCLMDQNDTLLLIHDTSFNDRWFEIACSNN